MRLRSPDLKPSIFLDVSNNQSPFGRLNEIKNRLLDQPDLQLGDEITKEFRAAANYIITTIGRININHLVSPDYDLSFHYHIELEITRELLKNFRLIIREFNSIFSSKFDEELSKCSTIEEYLSFQAERSWLALLESEAVKALSGLQEKIKDFLNEEHQYRKHFEFLPETDLEALKEDREGELFSYRLGILKKFIHEQLYLRVKYKNNNSYAIQSAAMIAAGFAGAFAYSVELLNRGYLGYSWEYNAGFLFNS